ncbi:MAG: sugar phosphate isomerase/epimerase [Bryobacteraceae bacterium]
MNRRQFTTALASTLTAAAAKLPAKRNIKWAVSLGLWGHFKHGPLTDVFDVMRDTGFIGIRWTGFPGFLKTYGVTLADIEREMSKRGLETFTISFGGPAHIAAQQKKVIDNAREAMKFLKQVGANHLVVFPPGRHSADAKGEEAFKTMCDTFNKIGEAAGEMGFRAGLHNHLDEMVETPDEVHRCMAMTDPKLFWFSPDTAHLHLGGSNVPEMMERYKPRLMSMDYKDAKWTTPTEDWKQDNGKVLEKTSRSAKFLASIYDLGDGEIDFKACHRTLKSVNFKGWICVDLDTARKGPRTSYERCGAYVVNTLEKIYL